MGELEKEASAHDYSEAARKVVHIGLGFVAFSFKWLTPMVAAGFAAAAVLFNWLVLPHIGGGKIARDKRGNDFAIVMYPVSVLLLILMFRDRMEVAAVGWVMMAFGDGVASIVGQNLKGPRLPWNPRKSVLGSLAFFEVALPMSWIVVLFLGVRDTLLPNLLILFIVAGVATIVESLETGIDDNLAVPLVSGLTMFALQEIVRFPFANLDRETGIWLAVNVGLAVVGYLGKSVNMSGFIGGIALGSVLIVYGGWQMYLLLLAFFVIGTMGTKLGYSSKAEMGIAQEGGGRRGFSHAFANVGCSAVLVFLAYTTAWGEMTLWLAAAAALATATADTTASEVGQLIGKRPFMPLTFRRVPVGTEGAISIEGTLAGALTATVVALFGAMAWSSFDSGNPLMLSLEGQRAAWTLKCAGLIALAAIAGSWLESVAGSWNRRHESMISNGTLNFFNTVAGAAMMFALARFLG